MPKIYPDFKEEMKPINPGQYLCKIVESKLGQSKSGSHYVQWELETVDGKRKLSYFTMTEGRGAGMFRHMIHAAGIDNYNDSDIDSEELHGRYVLAIVEMEEYVSPKDGQTKQRPKVKDVEKASEDLIQHAKAEDIPF